MLSRSQWLALIAACSFCSSRLDATNPDQNQLSQLIARADQALMRHDYEEARQLYHLLLREEIQQTLDPWSRHELALHLARAEKEAGNVETAKNLLTGLLKNELSQSQQIEGMLLLARSCHQLGLNEQAYALLRLIEDRIPRESWGQQERLLHSRLSLLLDDTFEQVLLAAQRAFEEGQYSIATENYQCILGAVESGSYPAAVRAKCTPEICRTMRFRIAECHYLAGDDEAVTLWLSRCGDAGVYGKYLAGLAHKRAGRLQEAIACFTDFLASSECSAKELASAEWELAYACLLAGRVDEARIYFQRRAHSGVHPLK